MWGLPVRSIDVSAAEFIAAPKSRSLRAAMCHHVPPCAILRLYVQKTQIEATAAQECPELPRNAPESPVFPQRMRNAQNEPTATMPTRNRQPGHEMRMNDRTDSNTLLHWLTREFPRGKRSPAAALSSTARRHGASPSR
jgi:hypothetical protein